MILLLAVLAIWFYLVIGFVTLALAVGDIPPLDGCNEFGTITGIVILLFWPMVVARLIVLRWQRARVKRKLLAITEDAPRVATAYALLGRCEANRVLEEIAIDRSLVEEEHYL